MEEKNYPVGVSIWPMPHTGEGGSALALGRVEAERAQPGLLMEAVLSSQPAVGSLQGRVLCLPTLGRNPALSFVLCSRRGLTCM